MRSIPRVLAEVTILIEPTWAHVLIWCCDRAWTDDLILQSAAVQIFMPPTDVHLFRDFTYEHATRTSNPRYGATAALPECIVFGGMAMGYDDPSSFANKTEAVRQYMMQMCKFPCIRKHEHDGRPFFSVTSSPVGVWHFHCDEWPQPAYCTDHPECDSTTVHLAKERCKWGCMPPYNAFNSSRKRWESQFARYAAAHAASPTWSAERQRERGRRP